MEGRIIFDNYQVRYREGLDLVLQGISCEVKGGEKVQTTTQPLNLF